MPPEGFAALRRFLGQSPPAPPPSPAVQRTERDVADDVVTMFAQDALVALQDFERSFDGDDPGLAREVGGRFRRYWSQAGLDGLDWSGERDDPQKIVAAVAELANSESGEATVGEASLLVASRGMLQHGVDDMRADVVVDDGPHAPDPTERLRESLARLGKARVFRDLVDLQTTIGVSSDVRVAVERAVDEAERLGDDQRYRAPVLAARDQAEARHVRAKIARNGLGSGTGLNIITSSDRLTSAVIAVAVCVNLELFRMRRHGQYVAADRSLQPYDQAVVHQHERLGQALDALPTATQRPHDLPSWRRNGNEGDRRGRDGR